MKIKINLYLILLILFVILSVLWPEVIINIINIDVAFCVDDLIRIGDKDLPLDTVKEAIKRYARHKRIYLDFRPSLRKANELGVFSNPELREKLTPTAKKIVNLYVESLESLESFLHENGLTLNQFLDWLEENDAL